jgi:hypothetical protein
MCNSFLKTALLTTAILVVLLATPAVAGNNNPFNIQEGPFAHAEGSIGQPRTKDTGNCVVNGRAPKWALDILISRGHGAAEDANGDELTLTDPVWANATCFRAKNWVSWEFGSAPATQAVPLAPPAGPGNGLASGEVATVVTNLAYAQTRYVCLTKGEKVFSTKNVSGCKLLTRRRLGKPYFRAKLHCRCATNIAST